ncbi:MAG: HPr family phosphocarrier protein [Rhodobacter sp.]|nr:HPr family phosphocarrier protein [Rhodobacter sp.]
MVTRTIRIINEKGLHARASAKFVEVVEAHDARALVMKDGWSFRGSIRGLLMLAASRGPRSTSRQVARGEKLADALEALVAARFERVIEAYRIARVRTSFGQRAAWVRPRTVADPGSVRIATQAQRL